MISPLRATHILRSCLLYLSSLILFSPSSFSQSSQSTSAVSQQGWHSKKGAIYAAGIQDLEKSPKAPSFSLDFRQSDVRIHRSQFIDWFKQNNGFQADIDFELLSENRDQYNNLHLRYQLKKGEIPVEHAILLVHLKRNIVQSIFGHLIKEIELDEQSKIEATTALATALSQSGLSKFAWEDPFLEGLLKKEWGDFTASYFPKAELVYINENVGQGPAKGKMLLAWKLDILDYYGSHSKRMYINAKNGELIGSLALDHSCGPASGTSSKYGPNKTFNTLQDAATGDFTLFDECNGSYIYTRSWNNGMPLNFSQTSNSWDNPQVQAAVTSHWGITETIKYFKQRFGRNGWDDNNRGVCIYNDALFDNNTNPNNATFSPYTGTIRFGAGNSSNSRDDFNAIDVIAHEFVHGVTSSSSDLIYEGESGALNEGISDIFGALVEFKLETDGKLGNTTADWLIGEDIAGGSVRDMSNPRNGRDPSTYGSGPHWIDPTDVSISNDLGGVHSNSGLLNYWFYLLSKNVATAVLNDDDNVISVQGIGIEKATNLAYALQTDFLDPSSNFADAREQSLIAASMLGFTASEIDNIAFAWDAVGVQTDLSFTSNFSDPIIKGTSIELYIQARNIGPLTAENPKISIILQNAWDNTVYQIASYQLDALGGKSDTTLRIGINVYEAAPNLPPGQYYPGFILDPDQSYTEKKEDNNTGIWRNYQFTMPTSSNLFPNISFQEGVGNLEIDGSNISCTYKILNTGNADAGSQVIKYYLSTDTDLSSDDYFIQSHTFDPIALGDTLDNVDVIDINNAPTPIPVGDYYILFYLDANDAIIEWDETDNYAYYQGITYGLGGINLRYVPNFSFPEYDENYPLKMTIKAWIENTGQYDAQTSNIRYFISTDRYLSSSLDIEVGSRSMPAMASGDGMGIDHTIDLAAQTQRIPSGEYFIGYIVDGDELISETNELDNYAVWFEGPKLQYFPTQDLSYAYSRLFPHYPHPRTVNNQIDAGIRIINRGNIPCPSFNLAFYLSADAEISSSDYLIHATNFPAIDPGGTNVISYNMPTIDVNSLGLSLVEGNYFLGTILDPGNNIPEALEDNNIHFWDCPLYIQNDGPPSSRFEIEGLDGLKIYPNPASDILWLEYELEQASEIDLLIYNSLGQLIKNQNLSRTQGHVKLELNVSDWEAGMYFLRFTSEKGSMSRKVKILK